MILMLPLGTPGGVCHTSAVHTHIPSIFKPVIKTIYEQLYHSPRSAVLGDAPQHVFALASAYCATLFQRFP